MSNHLPVEKQNAVLNTLAEGVSVRGTARLTGVSIPTILSLLVRVGEGCDALHDGLMRDLPCARLEMDEQWAFIQKKQRRVRDTDNRDEVGDAWLWIAICADTKVVASYRVGKRDGANADALVADLAGRVRGRVQLSTDGLRAYVDAVEQGFGGAVDYAQIVKSFEAEAIGPGRYSPPRVSKVEKTAVAGTPNMRLATTSHVESFNRETRMKVRRMTRLTNAHSKKLRNHAAALAFNIAVHNLVRRHTTLRVSPAMEAGVTDHLWSMNELRAAALGEAA